MAEEEKKEQEKSQNAIDYEKLAQAIEKGKEQKASAITRSFFEQSGLSGDELKAAVEEYKNKVKAKRTDEQSKMAEYTQTIEKQQQELNKIKIDTALKLGLLESGAKPQDIDYLIFKMSHSEGWAPKFDGSGKLEGLAEKLKDLKTQFPNQFEGSTQKKFEENRLEKSGEQNSITKKDFLKMGYQARLKLYNENPEAYNELNKKE